MNDLMVLKMRDEGQSDDTRVFRQKKICKPAKKNSWERGAKPVIEKFPDVPDIAIEFIKRNVNKLSEKKIRR